jgi:hypothetical protein
MNNSEHFLEGAKEKKDEVENRDETQVTHLATDPHQLIDEFPHPQISESIVVKQFQDRYEDNSFDERPNPIFKLRHINSEKQHLRGAESLGWETPHRHGVRAVPSAYILKSSGHSLSSIVSLYWYENLHLDQQKGY